MFLKYSFVCRVKPQDRIFEGVEATNETLNETCRCSHKALKNIACKCGFHQFVESCHLDLGNCLRNIIKNILIKIENLIVLNDK